MKSSERRKTAMLNLEDLELFVAFGRTGRLSLVAEEAHISQPSITRAMQRVEESFGASLFIRGRNRIELSETGKLAVSLSEDLLKNVNLTVDRVQDFDRSLRTFTIESCAPAPLWTLLPKVTENQPGKTINSQICEIEHIRKDLAEGRCNLGVFPYSVDEEGFESTPFLVEELLACLPKDHELANCESVTAQMLNGYNCFLNSEIGFWKQFCDRMPASRFLVQRDDFAFEELVRNSSLPCFSSTLVDTSNDAFKDRVFVPISDAEAKAVFHLVYPTDEPNMEWAKALRLPQEI